jgi:hypothetical protein
MALLVMVPGSEKHSSLPTPLFKLLQQKSFNFRKMKKVLTIRLMSFSFLSIFNRIFSRRRQAGKIYFLSL